MLGGSDPPVCRAVKRTLVERVLVERMPVFILIGRAVFMGFASDRDPNVASHNEGVPQSGREAFVDFDAPVFLSDGVITIVGASIRALLRGLAANSDIQISLQVHCNAPCVSGGGAIQAAFAICASLDVCVWSHIGVFVELAGITGWIEQVLAMVDIRPLDRRVAGAEGTASSASRGWAELPASRSPARLKGRSPAAA